MAKYAYRDKDRKNKIRFTFGYRWSILHKWNKLHINREIKYEKYSKRIKRKK